MEIYFYFFGPVFIVICFVCFRRYLFNGFTGSNTEVELNRAKSINEEAGIETFRIRESATECKSTADSIRKRESEIRESAKQAESRIKESREYNRKAESIIDECISIIEEAESKK